MINVEAIREDTKEKIMVLTRAYSQKVSFKHLPIYKVLSDVLDLCDEVERYRKALEFYANGNHLIDWDIQDYSCVETGAIARQALTNTQQEETTND
jgi:hypothetical protein